MSTIIADNLTGKTSAGSVTVTSEGGAATQSLQQGLAKAWVNFNGTGTIAARDSLNLTSLTDNGTGDYTVSYTNNMNNVNYSHLLNCNNSVSFNGMFGGADTGAGIVLTSSARFFTCSANLTNGDSRTVHTAVHGDMA
jgi:hypothetical protein